MRFKLGLAIGFAAGYWYASLSEEERSTLVSDTVQKVKDNPRVHQLTDTVSRNATKVTDAVESRFTETADKAGNAVASTAAPEGAPAAKAGSAAGPGSTTAV
jgi:hypothetical protein